MNCKFKRPTALRRMFCFPWAGGGASFYTNLSQDITDELEVFAFCLPGREYRFKEENYSNLNTLIDDIVQMLCDSYSDKPFIFFGHSMGALISFFVAEKLKRLHNLEPECMILSGASAPNTPGLKEKRINPNDMTKEDFIEKLTTLGGTPQEILDNPELLDMVYPVMRSDFQLLLDMQFDLSKTSEPPLCCPLDIFDGDQDSDHNIEGWRQLTSGRVTYRQLPGGHFYLKEPDNKEQIVSFINMRYGGDGEIV